MLPPDERPGRQPGLAAKGTELQLPNHPTGIEVLEPGQVKTYTLDVNAEMSRSYLAGSGTYDFNLGIDVCHFMCEMRVIGDNFVDESNEENNIFQGQLEVVAQE